MLLSERAENPSALEQASAGEPCLVGNCVNTFACADEFQITQNIYPRNMPSVASSMRSAVKVETCKYFNDTGKCAFGPGCRKEHNAKLLTVEAQSNLCRDDSEHRQQLTLHLASIPDGYQEADIIKVDTSCPFPCCAA